MTAEIAVLNKLAVSLAADSAVTIDSGSQQKIYQTVNKIFELHESQPIGLMLYGNTEFLGLPFEVLIKKYRQDRAGTRFNTVRDCISDFKDYLATSVPYSDQDQRRHAYSVLVNVYTSLAEQSERLALKEMEKSFSKDQSDSHDDKLSDRINSIYRETINDFLSYSIDKLKQDGPHEYFSDISTDQLLDYLGDVHQESIPSFFQAFGDQQTINLLKELASAILFSQNSSDRATGIVIAGFGENELCPSLENIEVDGCLFNRLKSKSVASADIGRDTFGAEIVGFAQKGTADLFLEGVDPAYEEYVESYVAEQLVGVAQLAISILQDKGLDPDEERIREEVGGLMQDFLSNWHSRRKRSRNAILEMVRFMPKEELSVLAASLIEITSLKKRVTMEPESVGGAVDVAVISRSEGLVWIKRKHYFDPELNSRFFERQRSKLVTGS